MSIHQLWDQTYICSHLHTKLHLQLSKPPGTVAVACCPIASRGINYQTLVWWLGIILMNLFTPGYQSIFCLITYLPWVHRQDVNTNPLPTLTRVWGSFFLDQAVADFEHVHYCILSNSTEPLELDWSLDEPDIILFSISSGLQCSVSIISEWQLVPHIKSHKLWCQASMLLDCSTGRQIVSI